MLFSQEASLAVVETLSSSSQLSSLVKDWTQTGFYLLTGILALLTYAHARRTLFVPFRTEAFKLQLAALQDVIEIFENHQVSLMVRLRYEGLLEMNYRTMVFHNRSVFLHGQVDPIKEKEVLDKNLNLIGVGGGMTKSEIGADYLDPFNLANRTTPLKAEEKHALWSSYDHDPIQTTQAFDEFVGSIKRLSTSPLLPRELRMLILECERQIFANLTKVVVVVNQAAKELPVKQAKGLKPKDLEGHYKKLLFNQITDVGKIQGGILGYVYDYLDIESLLPHKNIIGITTKVRWYHRWWKKISSFFSKNQKPRI